MKDWSAIAQAQGLGASASERDRIAPALERLEQAFRPLAKSLTPELEPCTSFSADPEADAEESPEGSSGGGR